MSLLRCAPEKCWKTDSRPDASRNFDLCLVPPGCSQAVLSSLFNAQIKFFEVTEEELDRQRKGFANGLIPIKIEETSFSMK